MSGSSLSGELRKEKNMDEIKFELGISTSEDLISITVVDIPMAKFVETVESLFVGHISERICEELLKGLRSAFPDCFGDIK